MKISASEVVLCATNEGEIYQNHLTMAREGATLQTWQHFILTRFMPRYRKHTPDATLTRAALRLAAKELQRYYKEHLKEF
jgi:hypothetical protein